MNICERKTCIFCNLQKIAGINILTSFICLDCEEEIVGIPADDKKYGLFIEKIKKIWGKLERTGGSSQGTKIDEI